MLNRVLLKSVLAAATVVVTGTAARADFIIDTFTTPNPLVTYSLAGTVGATYGRTESLPGDITRNLTVVQTQNTSGIPNQTSGYIGMTATGGAYSLATATGTTAYATLLYSYNAGPQNLSAAGSAVVFTGQADLTTPYSVTISDGTHTATVSGVVNSSTATSFNVPTSGFTGVDLSHVESIELVLNGVLGAGGLVDTTNSKTSADVALSDVRVTTPATPSVPAPPAAVLLLAAAPALGLTRLFRRKTTAAA